MRQSDFSKAIDASRTNLVHSNGGHAGSGGLQNHSIGALYPYIVYGQETPSGTRYGVLNGSTGASIPAQYNMAATAYKVAEGFKREDDRAADAVRVARSERILAELRTGIFRRG